MVLRVCGSTGSLGKLTLQKIVASVGAISHYTNNPGCDCNTDPDILSLEFATFCAATPG